jgi:hypothetical protein
MTQPFVNILFLIAKTCKQSEIDILGTARLRPMLNHKAANETELPGSLLAKALNFGC